MVSPHRRRVAGSVVGLVGLFILAAGGVHAQGTPPWKNPGHPFLNNPIGYARDLHRRYVTNQDDLARAKAALPTYKREKTGAEYSPAGFLDAVNDEAELARLRKAAQERITADGRTRDDLEREWAQWCELGLLGSPMPPLSAANEAIAETYLDNSTFPSVQKTRFVDRIDYNIRHFLEEKQVVAAPAAAGPGAGTFPKDPFNGLQITYSISGASLGAPEDGGPFEGWVRSYSGSLQGATLQVTGTVTKGSGASKEYPGHATISVWAGDKKADQSVQLQDGKSAAYAVSLKIPAGATAGGVNVHVWGDYANGEMRFVQVVAKLTGPAPRAVTAPSAPPKAPAPQPPVRPSDLGWGRLYPVNGPLQLAPAGRPETERAEIATNLPMGWVAGDRLVTGPKSAAVFIFPDDIRAVVGANTKLELRQKGAYLGVGSALCDLLTPGWGFTLRTPAAALQAAGSLFAAQVLEDGTTLFAVGIGTASVADAAGRNPVTVQAGNWARIAPGQRPSAPAPLTKELSQRLFGDAGLLLPLPRTPSGATNPAGRQPVGAPAALRLDRPAASCALGRNYPTRDFRFAFDVAFEKPGTILDTVGINGAPLGAFALQVGPDGTVSFVVYDPNTDSPLRNASGWHVLSVKAALQPRTATRVTVERRGAQLRLSIGPPGLAKEAAVALATPLSGEPAFLGDFPGDDHWGEKYAIHPAFTGTVKVLEFAP